MLLEFLVSKVIFCFRFTCREFRSSILFFSIQKTFIKETNDCSSKTKIKNKIRNETGKKIEWKNYGFNWRYINACSMLIFVNGKWFSIPEKLKSTEMSPIKIWNSNEITKIFLMTRKHTSKASEVNWCVWKA